MPKSKPSELLKVVVYRSLEPEDYNCILSDWAKSYKGSPWAGTVSNNHWHRTVKDTIDSLLSRGASVLLAVADDDTTQILGWVCYEKSASGVFVLHYIFVKDDFRGDGIAPSLLAKAGNEPCIHTHKTRDCKYLCGLGDYVPAIARRKELEPVNVKSKNRKRKFPRPCAAEK